MVVGLHLPVGPSVRAALDHLRPPSPVDLLAHAHKDWLHLNVFVPEHGIVALVNVSLHGDPLAPSSLAVGTIVVHRPQRPVVAAVDVREAAAAAITTTSIGVGNVEISVADGAVRAAARCDGARLLARGTPCERPIVAELPVAFGRGWIAWRALPRLELTGVLEVDGLRVDLAHASGYHDHNWGRWCWGDDAGWTWGTFHGDPGGPLLTVTTAHRTDRHHRTERPIARVRWGDTVRDFPPRTVSIHRHGRLPHRLLRLPGATAALRSDRRAPDLPDAVTVSAMDGDDHLTVEFRVVDAVQLVNADPVATGHTFVHELFGTFVCRGYVGGDLVATHGSGVFEHVD